MDSEVSVAPSDLISDFSENDIPWKGGQKLFEWWNTARGKRQFPNRHDFSPTEMVPILSSIVLLDVIPEAPTYRFRLVGTLVTDVLGFDPTGKLLEEVPSTENLRERYDWIHQNKKPYLCTNIPTRWARKDFKAYSTLVLPLGPTDDEVTMIMGSLTFS